MVKSWSVIWAVWRSVVGDLGGNIDDARRKRSTRHSPAKLASYISKYMVKAFEEGDDWSNRYSASDGHKVPPAVVSYHRQAELADLIGGVFAEVAAGDRSCTMWLSRFKDRFFISTEGPGGEIVPMGDLH
jgi:hypothetical protein